ncbi:MAG: hypothetical protein ABSG68_06785 [Thermoguttaceae bacterium]|jgi:hypothetical protein
MIFAGPPKKFIHCLNACLGGLEMIPPEEREGSLPFKLYQNGKKEEWVMGRGGKYFDITKDPQGEQPFSLGSEERLSIFIRIKRQRNSETHQEESRLAEYSLTFSSLSEGDARIASLRYDLDPGNATPNSPDWDEELHDNIAHPMFHLHVNFHNSERANGVRLALGQVSPILILRNFGVWYALAR